MLVSGFLPAAPWWKSPSSSYPDVWQFGSLLVTYLTIPSILLGFGALAMVTIDFLDSCAWWYGWSSTFRARGPDLLWSVGPFMLGCKAGFCRGRWSRWSGEQGSLCEKQRAWPAHQTCPVAALAAGCKAEGWRWNIRNGCCLRKLPPERGVGLEVGVHKKRLLRRCWSWSRSEAEDEQEKTLPKEVRSEPTQLWGKSGFRRSSPKDLHWNPEVCLWWVNPG